jgi:hypothetical protein
MVQDINDAYIEVRFVTNQGLFVPQYQDVRLESIAPTNPDSDPFDGLYTFTLSNGTEISGDFSDLAWYLGDVEITGNLKVDGNIEGLQNISAGGTLEVTGATTLNDILTVTGDTTITGATSITGDVDITGDTDITGDLDATGNAEI